MFICAVSFPFLQRIRGRFGSFSSLFSAETYANSQSQSLRPRLPSLRPLAGAPRQALLLSSWLRPASSTTTFIAHGGTGGSSRPSSSMNTNAAS